MTTTPGEPTAVPSTMDDSADHRTLRSGFTTGTAAAAAAKGAMVSLLSDAPPSRVRIAMLDTGHLDIPIHACRRIDPHTAVCTVIKDAGDDPDATHKAEIGARVTLNTEPPGETDIRIFGGEGVGRVTKPGLEIPPGEPAINPGPRRMIHRAVSDVLTEFSKIASVDVEIFVPEGLAIARRTLNARLGIVDGISILGTTGRVKPMSHAAYIATIQAGLSVARAAGLDRAVLTTGRRSEKHAQGLWPELPEEGFIQMGDFFKSALETAAEQGFSSITLTVFFGKAVKMAQGFPHTHAAKARLTLHKLADWALETTGDESLSESIFEANTARHAFEFIHPRHPVLIAEVGRRMTASARKFAGPTVHIQGIILDFEGAPIFDSDSEGSPA
ncbi:MAG: cobalt-precorrin-5B (C(1))-methyltransferase CbiD [Thermodesulfobacteriota bacterium]